MRPPTQRPVLAVLLCLALAPGLWWRALDSEGERTGNLTVEPLPLDAHREENGLTVAGVWLLQSDDRRFSGYSALIVQGDG